jgi:hypothetical protein
MQQAASVIPGAAWCYTTQPGNVLPLSLDSADEFLLVFEPPADSCDVYAQSLRYLAEARCLILLEKLQADVDSIQLVRTLEVRCVQVWRHA